MSEKEFSKECYWCRSVFGFGKKDIKQEHGEYEDTEVLEATPYVKRKIFSNNVYWAELAKLIIVYETINTVIECPVCGRKSTASSVVTEKILSANLGKETIDENRMFGTNPPRYVGRGRAIELFRKGWLSRNVKVNDLVTVR